MESRHSDVEVRGYYEENKARYKRPEALHLFQILLTVEPTAMERVWQEKKKVAEQVRDKAAAGEDFADLAYRFSDDPYKYKGGDLGFIHKGRLTPQELEDAAFGLKQGEVSGVIRTIHGFHILKSGERKPEEQLSFDEVREKIRKDIDKKRFENKKQELLDKLRKEYPVEISSLVD
jgi:peptidyl-prolyl cis-trans isomerase C